jgi:myo-inositol-1(or 4)-monophosphatase
MNLDLQQITEDVKSLALEAGRFLLEQRATFDISRVQTKRSHDYVSYVDKESERRIVERLKQIVPQAGFVTEEGTVKDSHAGGEDYCWVIDPLDGTTNYIHNNEPFCVSIALKDKNEILVGVVYECTRNELFWANKNTKSYLNGNEIHVSAVDSADNAFIQLGLPYDAESYRAFLTRLIGNLYGRVGGVRIMGSAAAEICYVAAGRFEARIEAFLCPWDIAAASLILKQAGGLTTNFQGEVITDNGYTVLASNGRLHSQMLELVKEFSVN